MFFKKKPLPIKHDIGLTQTLYTHDEVTIILEFVAKTFNIDLQVFDSISKDENQHWDELPLVVTDIDVEDYGIEPEYSLNYLAMQEQIFVEYGIKKSS